MAKQLQLRRGTTLQHSSFTGLVGEVTVDTDKDTAVVHDGSTAGGIPLATHAQLLATNEVVEDTTPQLGGDLDLNSNDITGTGDITAVMPALTGEVTTSAGAVSTTIASNIVDEDNLKVSNAGTNGQFLSKQSGGTGGLTWATVADPTSGIANTNSVVIDHASVADNDFAKFTANGLEGRSATEMLSELGSGTPGSANFLRGDGAWQTAGSTSASDLTSGTLANARFPAHLPASTFTAVADGAIAAGDECIITSAGKLAKITSSTADTWFGPSTSGYFNGWSTSNGFYFAPMAGKLWSYVTPQPFTSQDDLKQELAGSFKDSSLGVKIHENSGGGFGNMWHGYMTSSNTYSDYYWTGSITTIAVTGNGPNTSVMATLFSWLNYKQLVFQFEYSATVTNVNSTNFVGWADAAYADTANATVNLKGNIESSQSGLTIGSSYYLQKNGSLSTTADNPVLFVGIALAADKLLVAPTQFDN